MYTRPLDSDWWAWGGAWNSAFLNELPGDSNAWDWAYNQHFAHFGKWTHLPKPSATTYRHYQYRSFSWFAKSKDPPLFKRISSGLCLTTLLPTWWIPHSEGSLTVVTTEAPKGQCTRWWRVGRKDANFISMFCVNLSKKKSVWGRGIL